MAEDLQQVLQTLAQLIFLNTPRINQGCHIGASNTKTTKFDVF